MVVVLLGEDLKLFRCFILQVEVPFELEERPALLDAVEDAGTRRQWKHSNALGLQIISAALVPVVRNIILDDNSIPRIITGSYKLYQKPLVRSAITF